MSSRVCPQCSQVVAEGTAFCIRCGYRFQESEQVVSEDATLRQINLPNIPPNTDPAATLTQGGQPAKAAVAPAAQPVAAQVPVAGTLSYAQPPVSGSLPYVPGMAPSDPNQVPVGFVPPNVPPQGAYPPPGYGQFAYMPPRPASAGLATLQRAFAGKGVPVHHQSWLLDGKQIQPATLRASLLENIHKQGVPGISAVPERLREHSSTLEERDFVKVQYSTGTASVFVYMAPMGSNLYISRTSTIRQPFSWSRISTLIGLLVLLVISLILFVVINPATADILSGGIYDATAFTKGFFAIAFFGLLFFFLYVLLRSVVFWLTENDFLAYLRPNQLNDFTLDTVSSVEYITDKGIRETLKQAGLNADEVARSAQSYAPQQALHRF